MRDLYPRLFEPRFIEPDVPNLRRLEESNYRSLAVAQSPIPSDCLIPLQAWVGGRSGPRSPLGPQGLRNSNGLPWNAEGVQ
jgi:hypothetical protein